LAAELLGAWTVTKNFGSRIEQVLVLSADMSWSELTQQGFALAAIAADDPGAKLAKPGLSPSIAEEVTQVANDLAILDKRSRKRAVERISKLISPPLPSEIELHPRALSLLSPYVSRQVAQKWLAEAPLPRPGFHPEPDLRAVVRRIAHETARKKAIGCR